MIGMTAIKFIPQNHAALGLARQLRLKGFCAFSLALAFAVSGCASILGSFGVTPSRGLASLGSDTPTPNSQPNMRPSTKRIYKKGTRATKGDFVDDGPSEGSLWASTGQTNYYVSRNTTRNIGDIVSVKIEDDLVKLVSSEVKKTLSKRELEVELLLAQERLKRKAMGIDDEANAAAANGAGGPNASRTPAGQIKPATTKIQAPTSNTGDETAAKDPIVPRATLQDIDVSKNLSIAAGEQVMAEVLERFPNGNYKIRGSKRIAYNGQYRYVNIMGIVRGPDIGDDDSVASGKVYEYQLEVIR